ncbi:MAG: hypothetical protein ACTSSK_14670, partial [Candidatus Heimdallarchaeota archaeon]
MIQVYSTIENEECSHPPSLLCASWEFLAMPEKSEFLELEGKTYACKLIRVNRNYAIIRVRELEANGLVDAIPLVRNTVRGGIQCALTSKHDPLGKVAIDYFSWLLDEAE